RKARILHCICSGRMENHFELHTELRLTIRALHSFERSSQLGRAIRYQLRPDAELPAAKQPPVLQVASELRPANWSNLFAWTENRYSGRFRHIQRAGSDGRPVTTD